MPACYGDHASDTLTTFASWLDVPATVTAWAGRIDIPGQEVPTQIVLNVDHDGGVNVDTELTPTQARDLIEHLQALLGQIGAGQ